MRDTFPLQNLGERVLLRSVAQLALSKVSGSNPAGSFSLSSSYYCALNEVPTGGFAWKCGFSAWGEASSIDTNSRQEQNIR